MCLSKNCGSDLCLSQLTHETRNNKQGEIMTPDQTKITKPSPADKKVKENVIYTAPFTHSIVRKKTLPSSKPSLHLLL